MYMSTMVIMSTVVNVECGDYDYDDGCSDDDDDGAK